MHPKKWFTIKDQKSNYGIPMDLPKNPQKLEKIL